MKPGIQRYEPELLVLAPDSFAGEGTSGAATAADNVASLVSQLLEMGVAIELDDDWKLPTRPPRPLGSYKACLFPDTSAAQHDAALNDYYRGGGFLGYFKYYPTAAAAAPANVHHFTASFGRDAYFYHVAQTMIEGGLRPKHAPFLRAMFDRPLEGIIGDLRKWFFHYDRPIDVWRNWGDPTYTMFLSQFALADAARDDTWAALTRRCFDKMCDSKDEVLSRRTSENQLPDTADSYLPIMGSLFMARGHALGVERYVRVGLELTDFFLANAAQDDSGFVYEKWMHFVWSECHVPLPALYWAAKLTGDKRYARLADRTLRVVLDMCQAESGLWHHWADPRDNRKGALWSRGTQWPLLWMTQPLADGAVDASTESGALMLRSILKTFDALAATQDPVRGIWHLVLDEPQTRLESSASISIIYCHDRLRSAGLLDDRHDPMIERAFRGIKALIYGPGMAAVCRGTAVGTPDYYRTRPLGYSAHTLLGAACAHRFTPRERL